MVISAHLLRLANFTEICGLYHVIEPILEKLGISYDEMLQVLGDSNNLQPVFKINFLAMPLQDAIDFAVYCAKVQVEMDRILPGTPACGGPIDIMTLEMSPNPTIQSYPGKVIHHPEQ